MNSRTITIICPSYGAALRAMKRTGEEKVTGLQIARAWLKEGESTGERIIYRGAKDTAVESVCHAIDHDGGVLAGVLNAGLKRWALVPKSVGLDLDDDGDADKDDIKKGVRVVAMTSLKVQERVERSPGMAFGEDEGAEILADIDAAAKVLHAMRQIVVERTTRKQG
jgi:hypothetical protein